MKLKPVSTFSWEGQAEIIKNHSHIIQEIIGAATISGRRNIAASKTAHTHTLARPISITLSLPKKDIL
jgi:hypothetical protein